MSQSKLYSRIQLKPVPESILSPDVPVPPKTRPAQMDDPVAARRIKGSRHHDVMNTKRQKDNTNQVIRIITECMILSTHNHSLYASYHHLLDHHRMVTPVLMSKTTRTSADPQGEITAPSYRISISRRRIAPQIQKENLQCLQVDPV